MTTSRLRILIGVSGLLVCAAHAEPLEDPIPESIEFGNREISIETVADGMVSPLHATYAPGDAERIFVADQLGIVYAIELATGNKSIFLDISARTLTLAGSYDERGLLGLAFHPDYQTNGLFYTYTSEESAGVADFPWEGGAFGLHQSVINEWRVDNPTNPEETPDAANPREVMRIDQPTRFHNGGALAFDPDGFMIVSLGNGGPLATGQDNTTILGSILRIVPNAAYAPPGNHMPSTNGAYLIPEDNPFIADANALDEIFAQGFRNPFRSTVDRATGDIYAGDVGNNDIEEVNLVTAGANYGFPILEGSFCFVGTGGPPTGEPGVTDPSECVDEAAGLTGPLAEYDHDEGVAIIGGYVYRGSVGSFNGVYMFGDFIGRLFYLDGSTIRELQLTEDQSLDGLLLGMGEDLNGELYLLVNDTGRSSGTSGRLVRMDPVDKTLRLDDGSSVFVLSIPILLLVAALKALRARPNPAA
jgi:glucose/arabinose dehydrogenase